MVRHLAPGVADPVEALTHLRQHRQPLLTIRILEEDVLPAIATGSHVVQASGKFDAQWAGHQVILGFGLLDCKT